MSRDRLFLIIIGIAAAIIVCFGVGAIVLSLAHENTSEAVSLRVIAAISGMFSGLLGLVTGYLIGRRNGNDHGGAK